MMKGKKIILLCAAAVAALSCAKQAGTGANEANKRNFDAWLSVHYPNAAKTPLGAYVVEDTPGTGALMNTPETYPYVRANYTVYDLDGNVQATTFSKVAQQVGSYKESTYYGPQIFLRGYDNIYAGLEEAFSTMRPGGSRKLVVPGWLCTYGSFLYDESWYLENGSGTSSIYYLEPLEQIGSVKDWELDSIGRYVSRVYRKSPSDSLKMGFYYMMTGIPSSEESFEKDTLIYVNYIGRLLNGTVFDTNIKDTAIVYGLYSSSGSYGPKSVEVKKEYTSTTMGDSGLIDGFAFMIKQMHPHEKGTSVFWSGYGYSSTGSGSSIPAFSPLRFDIEVVDKN